MRYLKILILFSLLYSAFGKAQNNEFPHPERIKFDKHCLQIEGEDTFIYSGAFHYFRTPKELWADRFRKIKEAGFNGVETYIPWNWHEREMPSSPSDFSKIDLSELTDWIDMAQSFGFYIIVRPGPYICAEWDGGGFPQWLMQKRPANINREAWLQSDDVEFLKWNQHWYEAVCKAVAPYQITKKKKGEPGIIMFQIENEYERVNWFPKDMKRKYLEDLTVFTRNNGIEVPIFTCWTTESRNIKDGPLNGVFDFVNVYPRWNIRKSFGGLIDKQVKDQPNSPLMSAELQGGWYSEVGGQISRSIDGVAPVQTQNIALYAIQRGFSLINFYMLVGGTNFDDWASRETTTSYDFAAAIQENGGIADKYRRLKGIGEMLKEHGSMIARSEQVDIDVLNSDSLVEITLRKAKDGSRFFFVRTEARDRAHFGNTIVKEKDGTAHSFDYALEPFGSQVYYIPSNAKPTEKGIWYPQLSDPLVRPGDIPSAINFEQMYYTADQQPQKWIKLNKGQTLEHYKIYDRHFVYYRVKIPAGKIFTVGLIGDKLVNNSKADEVLAMVNGVLLDPKSKDKESISFEMPKTADYAILLFENRGLHHHTKRIVEDNWFNGIKWVRVDGKEITMEFASVEKSQGLSFSQSPLFSSSWEGTPIGTLHRDKLLTWHRIEFELPEKKNGLWMPWKLNIGAKGNGFIYLNGKCIGRYWNEGPQTEYYLPECWLNFGKGMKNIVAMSLRPIDGEVAINHLSVEPDKFSAEFRYY